MSILKIVANALVEDIGAGDITTRAIIPHDLKGKAKIWAKHELVLSGLEPARLAFLLVDHRNNFEPKAKEGQRLVKGDNIAIVSGFVKSLLTAERVALNFLQRMSGIATLTSEYVKRIEGTKAKIADTRKTAPGLRETDKMAVRAGGGINHRMGLFDAVLIKDNHIIAAGGVYKAVRKVKELVYDSAKVEVEVKNIEELKEAIKAGADIVMLDNMDISTIREAVEITARKSLLEASGNISLENVREVALTGVDIISVGKLTHSAPSADIAMDIIE